VAERELTVLREELKWRPEEYGVDAVPHPLGPGNAVVLSLEAEHLTAIFTGFGERGRPAEEVARSAVQALKAWLEANVPVDEHVADQLLIPMVLAGGGSFRTTKPSLHTTTNAEVIQRFMSIPIRIQQESEMAWRVRVGTLRSMLRPLSSSGTRKAKSFGGGRC
jgi:RNA 3'-terminal phosphate cyclase (ATP)